MITKPKSKPLLRLKYMLLLPVCVFLISAFTGPITVSNEYFTIVDTSVFISEQPSLFPVQYGTKKDITSHFGATAKRPKFKKNVPHNGIDIRAKIGTPVVATADGIIAKASYNGNWGNLIVIIHADGFETWYAHLDGFNSSKNQKVKKGDIIGYTGNTGLSTGPHLHYEVRQNEKPLNPVDYLR